MVQQPVHLVFIFQLRRASITPYVDVLETSALRFEFVLVLRDNMVEHVLDHGVGVVQIRCEVHMGASPHGAVAVT